MVSFGRNHGFTLVEMLVVLAIIVILAGVLISVTLRMENQSKERGVEAEFAVVAGALRDYYEYTGKFPEQPEANYANALGHTELMVSALQTVATSRELLDKVSQALLQNRLGGPMPEIYDPWGTPLDYRWVPGESFPELVSAGPDRQFGTSDDISSRRPSSVK